MKVKHNLPTFFTVGEVRLLPGYNTLTKEQYESIEKHPVFVDKVKKGLIEVIKPTPGKPSTESVVEEIKETYDLDLLEVLTRDSRDAVARAAKAQIDRINATAKGSNAEDN